MKGLFSAVLLSVFAGAVWGGCTSAYKQSIGGETTQVYNRVYMIDYNTAWQAVLDALKSSRLDVSNREGGFIQTRWTENTWERNLADSHGSTDVYHKAQYRFRINVSKGFYNGKPSVKVTVQKEQVVMRDVLEGWRNVETNAIDENTLMYRIGRIIHIRIKLAKLEEERTRKAIESADF